jgi:hypothetical protein
MRNRTFSIGSFVLDKARSREESLNGTGAGLGLSIANWAAKLHGENSPGPFGCRRHNFHHIATARCLAGAAMQNQ